ncbi:uncharacterized protein LOC128766409 isoform X2 [Synchiropus splendidus]|uniref:uncharacterized protein LOC128766409 isoform X2 n=1 Tax=Synchiropus splendidus TaxID=270530 RepID=UPI00237DD0EA|nr:uncharacterized protein LOC128766409 isoform X2 [Synchiropus splendidus]
MGATLLCCPFFIFSLAAARGLEYALKGHEIYIKPPDFVPPEKIFWRHNGKDVVMVNGREKQEYGSYKGRIMLNRYSAELWIKDVRFEDGGEYELEVWHKNQEYPIQKMYYHFEVIAKVSITDVSCEMDDDHQAKLVCSAKSSHPQLLTFEWSFDGTQHPGSNLTIGLNKDDKRVFTCHVKDPLSEDKATLAAGKCFPEKKDSVDLNVFRIFAIIGGVVVIVVGSGIVVVALIFAVLLIVGLVHWRRRKEVKLVRQAVKASSEVVLRDCGLSERSGSLLSSVLSSPSSRLTQLDLSYNYDLKDPGVELLSAGLKSPHCHLETLSLIWCQLSERSGSLLSSVLSSPSSRLTQLDLICNYLKDPGVELLSAGLKSPYCPLETLSLSGCRISERGCASLASALASNPSHLRELDLSFNHPGGPGLELLSAGLESPDWRLETLRLDHCGPQRLTSGLKRYFRPLSLDPDTAHRRLLLSNNNNMVELVTEDQEYLDHPDRFERCPQVMSRDAVTGVCYWEVEWRGRVSVAVTLRRDGGKEDESEFGQNLYSWSLSCSDDAGYKVCHNKTETIIKSSEVSHRVGVLLNAPAGFLIFFRVSSGVWTPLCSFFTPTEPLYLGFGLREAPGSGSSVCVYDLSV